MKLIYTGALTPVLASALVLVSALVPGAPSAQAARPPNLAYQYFSRGEELVGKKKYEEGMEKFQAALDLNPLYIESYVEWARAAVMAGKRRQGLEKLAAALAIARSDSDRTRLAAERDSLSEIFYTAQTFQLYQNGLNSLRLDRGGSAVDALAKALATEPDNVAVLLAYGRALSAEDRKKEAVVALERAFALHEGNHEVRLDLAEALLAQNPERAQQLLQPLLTPPEERAALLEAQTLSSLQRNHEAQEFLRVAYEKNPSWVYAPFWLGRLYALDSGGGWNARKYLMMFLKRTEREESAEAPEPLSFEQRRLRAARAEAEALLTRVNRSLE